MKTGNGSRPGSVASSTGVRPYAPNVGQTTSTPQSMTRASSRERTNNAALELGATSNRAYGTHTPTPRSGASTPERTRNNATSNGMDSNVCRSSKTAAQPPETRTPRCEGPAKDQKNLYRNFYSSAVMMCLQPENSQLRKSASLPEEPTKKRTIAIAPERLRDIMGTTVAVPEHAEKVIEQIGNKLARRSSIKVCEQPNNGNPIRGPAPAPYRSLSGLWIQNPGKDGRTMTGSKRHVQNRNEQSTADQESSHRGKKPIPTSAALDGPSCEVVEQLPVTRLPHRVAKYHSGLEPPYRTEGGPQSHPVDRIFVDSPLSRGLLGIGPTGRRKLSPHHQRETPPVPVDPIAHKEAWVAEEVPKGTPRGRAAVPGHSISDSHNPTNLSASNYIERKTGLKRLDGPPAFVPERAVPKVYRKPDPQCSSTFSFENDGIVERALSSQRGDYSRAVGLSWNNHPSKIAGRAKGAFSPLRASSSGRDSGRNSPAKELTPRN